jgi:DNA-binding NtrC family response regulator
MTGLQTGQRLLIVDDDRGIVDFLVEMLGQKGYMVLGTHDAREALRLLDTQPCDLVIADVEMPGMRGLDLMAAIHAQRPDQLVLMMTAFGSIDLAMQCVHAGACDFLAKPFRVEGLYEAVDRALRDRRMRRTAVRLTSSEGEFGELVFTARSARMRETLALAKRAAAVNSTVLLTGESGTGKSAVARWIHEASPCRQASFVSVNCAALPQTLVESELFGVRKGAYTDARQDRPGLFVQAHGGTLFLDEVAELSLEVQPKLLQSLESGKVRPLGDTRDRVVDVRLIAATNQPLEKRVGERLFRADLYHRLNVIRLEIPPLRERPEDIDDLVDTLVRRIGSRLGKPVPVLSVETLRWIRAYRWPGNVRELANTLERAIALAEHDTLLLEDIAQASHLPSAERFWQDTLTRGSTLEEVERAYIRNVLQATGGNKVRAARILGVDRSTLYRKLD